MEGMEVDEGTVVDLSVSSRGVAEMTLPNSFPVRSGIVWNQRRSLRPRTDSRTFIEHDSIVLSDDHAPKANGLTNGICESEDDEQQDLPFVCTPIKEMSEQQLLEREKLVRRIRDELRNEEMSLVLLKKLWQSHQMKENIAVIAPLNNNQAAPIETKAAPPRSSSKPPAQPSTHLLNRPSINSRSNPGVFATPPVLGNRSIAPGLPAALQPSNISNSRGNNNISIRNVGINFPTDRKDSRNSPVSVIPPNHTGNIEKTGIQIPQATDQERVRIEDSQTAAQRQAAAKLALRKQLEKTLLQIPPPKPPPPEMNFIPNPSNTEFIYLVGLEHVVDFITKDSRTPPPSEPFRCTQCSTNFTPIWKWEKGKGKDQKMLCEQCVTTNVKKALKAEHTNRLKTAFVTALQQEQEIEQRLAQGSPQPEPPTPQPTVKPSTPKPTPPIPSPNRDHLVKLADSAKFNHHAAAALHQQLLRGLPQHQPLPAHMIPFSPLLYQYQFAMAQAAGGKGSVAAAAANIVELQRQAADFQRQCLLDMIPAPNSRHSINNWKK